MNKFYLIKQTIKNKFINASRIIILYKFYKIFSNYLVVEYPKSGGTWLGQLISSYLDIPFPRNTFPKLNNSLFHGHYLPANNLKNLKNIFNYKRRSRCCDIIILS